MSKIRRALGNLDPIIYFENASGHLVLPPIEKGKGTELARMIYDRQYKDRNYEWKEAGSWSEVTRLQDRLVEQERKHALDIRDQRMASYDLAQARIADNLRRRMQSSDCTPYERDFCELFLQQRPDKRAQYEQRWTEAQNYLWAVEMDSSTKPEDRMKGPNSL